MEPITGSCPNMNKYPFAGKKYAFTVCRIEPENNIHVLLEAFVEGMDFPLVAVGNWDYSEYGRQLKNQYSSCSTIFMLDPIYEPEQLNALRRNCFVYLHGHSCGGTNPSLVEAMYCQLSIIAYDVNFNRETTENKALYFLEAEDLRKICRETSDTQFVQIAANMRQIAERRYTWERISQCYAELL